ncbi:hypothetical protein PINS_up004171 [Pythium insidiosum]|nr:hypothetical protein PINS_up004171 [Pythium insidiosum]
MVFTKLTQLLALAAVASLAVSVSTTDAATPSFKSLPRVHPSVHRTLRQQGTVHLIVKMKQGTHDAINSVKEADYTDRGKRIEALVQRLEANAQTSQTEVAKIVAQEAGNANGEPLFSTAQSFWIENSVLFRDATPALIEKLSQLSSVAEIREEQVLHLPPFEVSATNTSAVRPLANEWGVAKISAPSVWAAGNRGEGVVVGAIDTGVLSTHEAIKANFRGNYGWYDPAQKKPTPYDDNGHGTHVIGTIAGANGIGVAPGATWMMCRGCTSQGCSEADLLACAQFMTCPTDTSGNNKDCSKAPKVVSNSWGGGQGDTFYDGAISAWQAAGIVPVFANGNEGPDCKTASSPGDNKNVIAVGATDVNDGLGSFSSKGPSVGGLIKPEVSAPGVNVRSSWNSGNSGYNTISGTSMATPHVSGVVTLLLKAKPGLTFDQVRDALTKGVDTASLKSTGYTCGGTSDTTFPNNQYGFGRVNAAKVVGSSPVPPSPTTPAPTTPTTPKPKPTTVKPVTPKPTTAKPTQPPSGCAGLSYSECEDAPDCYWSWWYGQCRPL